MATNKTSLKVKYRDTGGTLLQKTVTYANPSATDAVLSSFVQQLVGLTTATYVTAERTNTYDIEEALAEAEEAEGGE